MDGARQRDINASAAVNEASELGLNTAGSSRSDCREFMSD
jgi:hypothetical protein